MENEYDLPEILASIYLSDVDDIRDLTIDDFYDFMGIPKNDSDKDFFPRTDFMTAAVVKQAYDLLRNVNKVL